MRGTGTSVRRERGEHRVLARHVVRGRQHVAERRPAQHPLVRAVADRVREVRATAGDQRRVRAARRPRRRRARRTTAAAGRDRRPAESPSRARETTRRVVSTAAVTRCGSGAARRAGRCRAGSGRPGRRACRRGSRRRRAPLRTRRPRSRTRGARGPSRGTRRAPGTSRQTARACASRTARASGRSPAGAKNSRVWPWQAASFGPGQRTGEDQVGDRLGGHGVTLPDGDVAGAIGARGAGGGNRLPELRLVRLSSEPDHKTICQRRCRR